MVAIDTFMCGEMDGNRKNETNFPPFNIRGHYSESITDPDYKVPHKNVVFTGVTKRNKLLSQIKTERNCPILRSLLEPRRQVFLAPAERWMSFEEDQRIVIVFIRNLSSVY